jgi:hypothetical protein
MPQITIGGQVHMIAWEGKRVSIWENIHANGKDFSRLWTCWFDAPTMLQEQDFAEITGELSTKIGEYTPKGSSETKRVVEHHIQGALLKAHRTQAEQAASSNMFEDESPF